MSVGEKADVTNAVKAVGHGVLEEAADEPVGGQRHDLGLAVMAAVLPGEIDPAVVECHEASVGDGDAMGVATEIAGHLFGAGKRWLGEDHPVDAGQLVEPSGERGGISQVCECAGQAKLTRAEGGAQLADERVAEATRTGRKKPGRHAIQRVGSGEMPPPGPMQCKCG